MAIAIDLDETISMTDYLDLLWGGGQASKPCKGSVEALNTLANDYQILYYSARPRTMIDRTRKWLVRNGFPPGPILFAANIGAAFDQGPAKGRLLSELHHKWPNVRIGIGDKSADVQCCAANGMLPIIVNPWLPSYKESAVVVRDWSGLLEFFERHADTLKDMRALAQRIELGTPFDESLLTAANDRRP